MARTNIDIDEDACAAVMRRFGCRTKRDAVNLALRQAAATMTLDEALAMRGTGWDGDLDEIVRHGLALVILIDSSAWIEYLRDGDKATADVVERLLGGEGALTEPVVMEILAGAGSHRHGVQLRALLGSATLLPVEVEDWTEAALLYRLCRINGVTVRSMVDCLIAAVGIRHDIAVLAKDRDFDALAAHTPMRLAAA